MITSPSASALKNSDICVAWESSSSRNSSSASINKPFLHSAPPSDPLRQANRLPIKVLKMLTARSGHILHPEYLQPLPSTPVSPIEVRRFSTFNVGLITVFDILVFGVSRDSVLGVYDPVICPANWSRCSEQFVNLFVTINTVIVLFT